MSGTRILCLGAGEGWHAKQLRAAAADLGCRLAMASYESLRGSVSDHGLRVECEAGAITEFDVLLTRTMPAGSLEQITFRLATLHALSAPLPGSTQRPGGSIPLVNPPRGLEIAIDKFATLGVVARLGYAVPETMVVQSRGEALDAFRALGGDCVIKPIFGGEGRGVMRISDPELAWYTFSTLENLDAVCYVQRFVPPGGRDIRLLVIGDEVIGVRRINSRDFRTNVAGGGHCEAIDVLDSDRTMALRICRQIGLKFASVDLIDDESSGRVVEVNGIPGWKGAQQVVNESIAHRLVNLLIREASPIIGAVG
jgi:ribosomal protein S6--L-glutamate ligase